MLLKVSTLMIILIIALSSDLRLLGGALSLSIVVNLIYQKDFYSKLRKLKKIIIVYLFLCLMKIILLRSGQVIEIYNGFYITREGIVSGVGLFIKIMTLLFTSWLIERSIFYRGPFKKYARIVEVIIEIIPEVFSIFKMKRGLKWSYRYIMKQIKVKI